MSFLRHREIFRPMWHFNCHSLGATTAVAPTHRLDEFPAGYSLASCSPAELASASPTVRSMIDFIPVGNDLPANGNLSLFFLSQVWGAVQPKKCFTTQTVTIFHLLRSLTNCERISPPHSNC